MKQEVDEQLSAAGGSLPSRGAWIETLIKEYQEGEVDVAPLAGGVD